MSSKRPCIRAPVQLSNDAWSHVIQYLFHDAFEAACDLANMSRVSRAWRDFVSWKDWASSFGFFPLQQEHFPDVLAPIMICAREGEGAVARVSAMEHLKIPAQTLKTVPHATFSVGYLRRVKYIYKIEDLFRAASVKYTTIAKLEVNMARCRMAAATREKNRLLKLERRDQVSHIFHSVDYFFDDDEVRAYINRGGGTLDAIRETALARKRERDERRAKDLAIEARRSVVDRCAFDVDFRSGLCMRNFVVLAYIYDGIGNVETVTRACLEEKDALKTRRRQYAESPTYGAQRRGELLVELASKGLSLRSDSLFCKEYISGESNACVEEVVATMEMTNYLFMFSHRVWSRLHHSWEKRMREMVRTREVEGWYDAYERVKNSGRTIDYDSDDSYDWKNE